MYIELNGSARQLVRRQFFDSSDVAGTAVEAAPDVGVCRPAGAPFQDAALQWSQRFPSRPDAVVGHSRVCDHPIDELRLTPETASDLDVVDAAGDEAQNTAFERPQGFVVNHRAGLLCSVATLRVLGGVRAESAYGRWQSSPSYAAYMALDDELLNKVTWKIPNALALIGSRSGDERNAMTASWITQLSMEPVLIGVAVDNDAITCRLIADGGSFTVNLWDASDTRVFVKFSKPAVDDGSTLNGRAVRSATTGAPVFDEAVAWMDCEVRNRLDLGTHTLFVGEVVDAAINDPDARTASMSDTRMKYGGVKRH
jgi:flavin reductase (DIM6/NTAB) family NADH-FMN oxidoreductase RutF